MRSHYTLTAETGAARFLVRILFEAPARGSRFTCLGPLALGSLLGDCRWDRDDEWEPIDCSVVFSCGWTFSVWVTVIKRNIAR